VGSRYGVPVLQAVVTGFLAGLSLIVAIGAQNAYVLRQGIARNRTATVVAICALSDALLITLGVAGVGLVVAQHPTILLVFKVAGAAYLVWFAIQSFRAAAKAKGLQAAQGAGSARGVVLTALALTYVNPHVYLDTVLMLCNLANQQGGLRWWFALGAATASLVWFTGLGFGGRALAPYLARPKVWRVIDIAIGVTMLVIAAYLLFSDVTPH